MNALAVHEKDVQPTHFPDRWSKDLIGTPTLPTTSGFNVGRANYTAGEFGAPQVHEDQEAVYVISGVGEVKIGEEVIALEPGVAFYVAPRTPHCARRTRPEPVMVVYTHGAV